MIMKVFSLTIIILVSHWTMAQVQEQLSPTEKRYQSIVTEPLTIYKGFFRVGVGTVFSISDKMFNDKGKKVLIENNGSGREWLISPYVQYGITDRLQAEVELSYESRTLTLSSVYELPESDTAFSDHYSNPTKGFNDLTIALAYQLIHGNYTKPFLGAFLRVEVPTAEKNPTNVNPKNSNEYNAAPGTGQFSLEPALKFRKIIFPYSYDVGVAYKYNLGGKKLLRPDDKEETSFKPGNKLNATASFNIHLNNWIILKNTADFSFFGKGSIDGKPGSDTSWLLMLYPGLTFQLKGFRIATTVAYPAMGKTMIADPLYIMNFVYTF